MSPIDLHDLLPGERNGRSPDPAAATGAQTAASRSEAPDTVPPADQIPRRRDGHGNRLPWSFSHHDAFTEDVPLEGTPMHRALEPVREALPLLAGQLHTFWNHRYRFALRGAHAVRQREEDALAARNAAAGAENAGIIAAQEALRRQRDEATATNKTTLAELDVLLAEAHQAAAIAVAAAGGCYDPADPGEAAAIRLAPATLETLAGRERLPWTPADGKSSGWAIASWTFTLVVGACVGASIGIIGGFLPADAPFSQPGANLAAFLAFGLAAAALGKDALRSAGRIAAERYYLRLPWTNWWPFAAAALASAAAFLLLDACVERSGLLANLVRQQELLAGAGGASTDTHDIVYWLGPILLTLGYVCSASWDGYLHGRRHAVINRLRHCQETEFGAADVARRREPGVQVALHRIALVREIILRQEGLRARTAAAAAPFDERIAALEARRLPERLELDEAALQRIQEAHDQAVGAQCDLDALVREARRRCEPPAGWWSWIAQFRRAGRAAGRIRETRR